MLPSNPVISPPLRPLSAPLATAATRPGHSPGWLQPPPKPVILNVLTDWPVTSRILPALSPTSVPASGRSLGWPALPSGPVILSVPTDCPLTPRLSPAQSPTQTSG